MSAEPGPRPSPQGVLEHALGMALLVGAFMAFRLGAPLPLAAALAAFGILLLARAFVRRRREEARQSAIREETRQRLGPENRPIDPDLGVGFGAVIVGVLALVVLALEFHPVTEWLLERTGWALEVAPRECYRPLRGGDFVLVRMGDPRPRPGMVVWLRQPGRRHRELATVFGSGPDSLGEPEWIRVDEDGETRPRWARGYARGERLSAGSDSLLVCSIAGRDGRPRFIEKCARDDAEGVAIAIVAPPNRWRRLS